MATFVPRFLRQLRDILISSPTDGQVLTYDSADQKWKNEAGGGGGGTPGGASGELQYNNAGGFGGAAFGKYLASIPAWGEPGVVDPVAGDDSSGWVALVASASFSDITVGFGSGADFTAELTSSSGRSGIETTDNVNDGKAYIQAGGATGTNLYVRPSTGQTAPVLDLRDETNVAHTRIGPEGQLGFFGVTPAAQPAAPATTQEFYDRIASLGLIDDGGTIASGGLSGSPQTYTESNVTTDRTYNANAMTLDELADVLGTLIADLRARGVVA